jgi:hypothetical protein
MTNKRFVLAVLISLGTVLGTACGGVDDSTTTTTSTVDGGTSTTTASVNSCKHNDARCLQSCSTCH